MSAFWEKVGDFLKLWREMPGVMSAFGAACFIMGALLL